MKLRNLKDAYKLKWFGNYMIEVDTDDIKRIKAVARQLKKAWRFRFISFILMPMGTIKLTEIKEDEKTNDYKI